MLKSIENFASYVHIKTGNLYTRHVCSECYAKQRAEYKKSMKPRTCTECNETKQVRDFPNYKSLGPNDKRHNICKKCTSKLEKQRNGYKYNKRELNGEPVLDKPNTYRTEQQRIDGFELMEALGFTFNEENGIWFKEGLKTPDGKFVGIQERKRLKIEALKKEVEELDIWSKIRYLREKDNLSINKIADISGLGRNAIFNFLKNGKKLKKLGD
jgi:hypothetical protein